MLGAIVLLGWATVLSFAAPAVLRRARWPSRAPRLAVLVWQTASASFVVALVLGGLALAVPATVLSGGLAELAMNCVMAVRDAYRTPAGAGAAGAGLVLAISVAGRVGWCLVAGLHHAARRRREHARRLSLVACRDDRLGVLVVEHATPLVYCLPGHSAAIVVTSAAINTLQPQQLTAVLAHERAHVRARHHLVVAAAAALARAFPRVPLLREAGAAIPALVEMAADDAASRRTDRTRVATSLAELAGSIAPEAALGAAALGALARVQRLLRPAAPLSRLGTVAALGVAIILLAAPAAAAVAPAWIAGPMSDCRMVMAAPGR